MDWQPIETAPKDGAAVDLYVQDGDESFRAADCYWSGGEWQDPHDYCDERSEGAPLRGVPTHWMPLPEPPHGT